MNGKIIGLVVAAAAGYFLISSSAGGGGGGGGGSTQERFGRILGSPAQGDGGGGGVSPVGSFTFPQETFKGFAPLEMWTPELPSEPDHVGMRRPRILSGVRDISPGALAPKKQVREAYSGVPSGAPESVRQMLAASQLRKSGYSPGSGAILPPPVKETKKMSRMETVAAAGVKGVKVQ